MRKLIYVVLVVLVLLVACSKDKEKAEDNQPRENNVKAKEKQEQVQETESFAHVYPLTGIGTDEDVDDRIVGVMVNNHTAARPQSGLSQADIVFEILAEGRITRFLALFQSEKPDVVGPVRSAREYYINLANRYNALYVYHGAANFVNDMIGNRGIEHLDGAVYDNNGHLFKRESFRKAPHNSYLQFQGVNDVAESKGYEMKSTVDPLPFLSEEEADTISGDPAKHIEIVYSSNPMNIVEYDYDEVSQKYTRFSDHEKTVELNSEIPIELDNVFIVETYHEVIDNAGRRAVDLDSGGKAYLIQKGKIQQLEWENRDGRIMPVKDGNPVGFVPGKTWINVVPSSPGMAQSVTISGE